MLFGRFGVSILLILKGDSRKESVKKDIVMMSFFYNHKNEIDTGTAFAKNLEGFCSSILFFKYLEMYY